MQKKDILILLGILVVHLFLLVNIRFTAWPEMLAWPYFIVNGWLPYRDIAIAHTPILLFVLSFFYKIFGIGVWQLKVFGWAILLSTDLILFYIVNKLWNRRTAFLALLCYIPLQLYFDGNGLWFDYLVTPVMLLSFYLIKVKKFFWAGVFWAMGFFTKQTAFWFLPVIILILWDKNLIAKLLKFVSGSFIVSLFIFLLFWFLKIIPDFIFWAFKFGVLVLPRASGQISLPGLRQALIAFIPFSILFLGLRLNHKKYLPILIWAVLGLMGVFPRWELFHFQPGLPYLATGTALIIGETGKLNRLFRIVVLIYLGFVVILLGKNLIMGWHKEDRFLEKQTLEAASFIKENTKSSDRIFVLNYWDSIYALSDRLPATKPWFPQLLWVINLEGVEDNMLASLEPDPPKYIIAYPYAESGFSSFKPGKIVNFIFSKYRLVKTFDGGLEILEKQR